VQNSKVSYILTAMLLASLSGCEYGDNVSDEKKPDVRIVSLGEIFPAENVVHSFRISNTTPSDLQVTEVIAPCSCNVVDKVVGRIIPKGGFLDFPVALRGVGREESATVVIHTDSNDISMRQIRLTLEAKYLPAIWSTPSELQFRNSEPIAFEIHSRDGVTLTSPLAVFSKRKFVDVDIIRVSPHVIECSAKINRDIIPRGNSNDFVSFDFEGQQGRNLDILAKISLHSE